MNPRRYQTEKDASVKDFSETRPDNSLIRSYVWGTDLSGTSQGAGGVGGLLEISYYGSSTTNCFPAYDGNGNIMALVNAADGTVAANYDYAAFGEPIRITGVMARNNPFRFSTKYADDESDLLYYGYRYYKPSTGTWPNRDPLQEQGGMNVYGFINNNPILRTDYLGYIDSSSVDDYSSDQSTVLDGRPAGADTRKTTLDHTIVENGVSCTKFTVHVTVKYKITYYNPTKPGDPTSSKTGKYKTISDHEHHHEEISDAAFTAWEKEFNDKMICCSKCINLYYQFIESNWSLAVAKQGRDNIQFDMDEYLDNSNPNVVKAINAANQNLNQATQDVDAAKKAYDDCQSQSKK